MSTNMDSNTVKNSIDEEMAADQFAAELLMPEKYIRLMWANNKSIAEIQNALNVSDDMLGQRLLNLGLIEL